VPALKGAGTALEAVAAGIVTATNVAGSGVVKLGGVIETTFPAFAVLAANVKGAGAAMEAFSPSLAGTATRIEADLDLAMQGRIPLDDLLGKRELTPEEAATIHVTIDNAASPSFSVVEVRAPDQVGLLYRIASALHAERLDIQHARIATHPDGAFDVFYVRNLQGQRLDNEVATRVATSLTARLRGVWDVERAPG